MDTKLNGVPFSVLISQAAKLKTAQAAPSRSKYDTYPSFYQHSIYPRERVTLARCKQFRERMVDAIKMKNEGNEAFKCSRYDDAITQHEMAISVFRFLENVNPDWKTEVSVHVLKECFFLDKNASSSVSSLFNRASKIILLGNTVLKVIMKMRKSKFIIFWLHATQIWL